MRVSAGRRQTAKRRPYEPDRRGKTIAYDGREWIEHVSAYRPEARKPAEPLQLRHMTGEIVSEILAFLDAESLYRFCHASRAFHSFLSDYGVLKRHLAGSINADMIACRWELVRFKHRHGIRCGWETSRRAMEIALSKRNWAFVKYLMSVGKKLDPRHVRAIVEKEGSETLRAFLSKVRPDGACFSAVERAFDERRISETTQSYLDKYRYNVLKIGAPPPRKQEKKQDCVLS
jgi:hypothetical protein